MASQVMRITLKAYDHQLVDQSAGKIIETVKKTGSQVSGPVPLPTKKEVVTILRAVHKYKDSREQFEQRTHKRLIDITAPSQKTGNASWCVHRHQDEDQIIPVSINDYVYILKGLDIEATLHSCRNQHTGNGS